MPNMTAVSWSTCHDSTSDPGWRKPSASTLFLPQLRRSRRGSLASLDSASQVGKETLAEALDQIHTTASQSDALTTFNEYTSPPSSSSGPEGKGIASDLHGGLSGLYSRLRASVGNVKDIVTPSSEDIVADDPGAQSPRLAIPSASSPRFFRDPAKSPSPPVKNLGDSKSVSSSRHSSRAAATLETSSQNGARSPRLSNGTTSGMIPSSKVIPKPNVPLQSPANMAAVASPVATPAVAEVNVSAVREPLMTGESTAAKTDTNPKTPANPSTRCRSEEVVPPNVGLKNTSNFQTRRKDRSEAQESQPGSPSLFVTMANPVTLGQIDGGGRDESLSPKFVSSKGSPSNNGTPNTENTSLDLQRPQMPSLVLEHPSAGTTVPLIMAKLLLHKPLLAENWLRTSLGIQYQRLKIKFPGISTFPYQRCGHHNQHLAVAQERLMSASPEHRPTLRRLLLFMLQDLKNSSTGTGLGI